MTTKTTLSHRRGWLAPAAAASLARVDARLGRPLDINSAGRTHTEQARLWHRYYILGDRSIGRPAFPGRSNHESGLAIDTDDRISWIREHGWVADVPGEPWHYEYRANLDRHIPKPKPKPQTRMVRKGDRGPLVAAVQARLRRDYPLYASRLVADGIFGPATDKAVREFQRRAGLRVDGIVGPATLARLGL